MIDQKYFNPVNIAAANKKHNLRPFEEAPASKVDAPIIELDAIDLSDFSFAPEDFGKRKALADTLEKAVLTYGFFKLVGHGVSESQIKHLKSLGQSIFEIPQEEKDRFVAGQKNHPQETQKNLGVIRGTGFKPKGHWKLSETRRDVIECFNLRNLVHDHIYYNETDYPEFVKYHLKEIQDYYKHLHFDVLRKVLTLFDIILQIPEGTLWKTQYEVYENDIPNSGGGFARFIFYHPVDEQYTKETKGTLLRGHSDGCGLTFIILQPILSLQIRDHTTGEWKFILHTENALIVNLGDAFQLLTGNYFKSAIHRVATPPPDQRNYKRNTLIYFSRPNEGVWLDPSQLNSPKLDLLNITRDDSLKRITFAEWDDIKNSIFNNGDDTQQEDIKILGRDTVINLVTKSFPIPGSSA